MSGQKRSEKGLSRRRAWRKVQEDESQRKTMLCNRVVAFRAFKINTNRLSMRVKSYIKLCSVVCGCVLLYFGWREVAQHMEFANVRSAIRNDDIKRATILARKYNNVSLCNKDFSERRSQATLLHYAVRKGGTAEVEEVIKLGGALDCQTKIGHTPLHEAVLFQKDEIVLLLLRIGADPNLEDQLGNTPIFYARKNTNIISLLLKFGAYTNISNHVGKKFND